MTNTVDKGQPSDASTVTNGTRTVTVAGTAGETISRTLTDLASGLAIEQALYSGFDGFHRPWRVDYLDGTYETTTYACCGIDSQTDRTGATTSYQYDLLRRPYITTRDGISMIRSYDAEGRMLSTVRQGTDSSQITLSRAQYNVAGQQVASFEPKTGITTYLEQNGTGRTVTTTYTNGATRIETYAADGALTQVSGTAVHGIRYDYGVETNGGVQRAYSKAIKRNGSSDTSEWTKTYADMLGRTYKTLYPDNAFSQSWYNNLGQLTNQVDPDGVITLYAYNGKGEREYSALDLDRNNQIDYGGTDRITRTVSDVVSDHGYTVRRAQTFVWPTNSANTPLLSSVTETAVNGLYSWSTNYGLARQTHTIMGGSGYVTTTNIAPDGSYSVTLEYNGRVLGTTNYDANNGPLGSTVNGYDSHRRLTQVTDGRNGTTTYAFNDAGQVTSVTTPSPGGGQSGLVTSTAYDLMGQAWRITQPDTTYVTNRFDLMGQMTNTCGSRNYPVCYTFDYAGRMATMTTWTNYASAIGAATTTWNYDSQRGWLNNKRYNDGTGPDYSYTAAGRLRTRAWARQLWLGTRVTTTNTYNNAGDLGSITYNDSATPGVTNTFDRLGRLATVFRDTTTTTLAYNDAGQQVSEFYAGGPFTGFTVTNRYDAFLRRTNLSLLSWGNRLLSSASSFDAASRLQAVSDGTNSATYCYLANSPLVDHVLFTNNGVFRMARTNRYDYLNRLLAVTNRPAGGSAIASVYGYNLASQRTGLTNDAGERWDYKYDYLGQATNGWKYDSSGQVINDHRFAYFFDDIGNRKQTVTNGTT
ncbi:MAG: type IV secretion protein Rhs, partial [Verrucomicrobiota bacterium]